MKNGELSNSGNYKGCRWCTRHKQFHGPLFQCESYPLKVKLQIRKGTKKLRENYSNPDFIKKELKRGIREEEIVIMQFFAGLR
jgi:hypothetical protein